MSGVHNPGRRPLLEVCPIDSCGRPARHWADDAHVCRMHWKRWSRSGSFEKVRITAPPRAQRETCVIEDCQQVDEGAHGLCKLHAGRLRKHGDPLKVIAHEERQIPTGPAHPGWTGDNATYSAVHQRLQRVRGRARQHRCVDCGERAAHWSLDRSARQVLQSAEGPYSTDLAMYAPRCVPCHKRYDLAAIGASQ